MKNLEVIVGTVFEKELPISIRLYKFRKTLSYGILISRLHDINGELRALNKIREIIEMLIRNSDLIGDLIKIESSTITPVARVSMDWGGNVVVTLNKRFIEELGMKTENMSATNIQEIIDIIEKRLKEEKRKLIEYIKELSRRKLLTVTFKETSDEDEDSWEDEDDC